MAIVTTPVLIAAAALALFFLAMGALNTWGEKHRHENPYLNRGTDATDHHQRCSGNTRARNIGDDRPSFQQLAERAVYANQLWSSETLDAFNALEVLDPELVRTAMYLFGKRELAAEYFARKHERYGNVNCYAALAAGKRERIVETIVALQHGIFL